MTMILSLANRDNVIQLSDRRLTTKGQVMDEEAGKAGTLFCANGRFSFGFTGIARATRLEVRRWILDALLESGPTNYMAHDVLERFKFRATDFFNTNQTLKRLSPSDKRLSIMFTGYLYNHNPPMIGCAIVSNYINPSENLSTLSSWEEFSVSFTGERKPRKDNISYVQRIGAWPAMNEQDEISVRSMLEDRKPVKAIIEKAVSLMKKMADRPGSSGTIGKQITWIRIPSNISDAVESGYHTNIPTHTVFLPSYVIITSDDNRRSYDEPKVSAVDPTTTPPMAVPKVHRNAPCPCGSGKKYKRCHGKKYN